jgi:chitinase
VRRSRELLKRHLLLRPTTNPFARFHERFERDLGWLQENGLNFYHLWAFGTIRQAGAAFELAASHLAWLQANGQDGLAPAIESFNKISAASKTLILKAARGVNSKRAFDGSAMFQDMANAWDDGIAALTRAPGL